MAKILMITVGGSHQPIVTAISSLKPNRVVFICSDGSKGSKSQIIGEGKPCEVRRGNEVIEKLPNIPTQLNLRDRFQADKDLVLLNNPDDLSECYRLISEKIRSLKVEVLDSDIFADYTGGTKSMSVALAIASLDYALTVYLTTSSTRENIIRVERGERSRRVALASVTVQRKIEQFLPGYLEQYNYPAAIAELKYLLQKIELSPEDTKRVEQLLDCCSGFDAWDRFDHATAWTYLSRYIGNQEIKPAALFLKRVMGSREAFCQAVDDEFQAPDKIRGHEYEIVEDLLLNAQRRAILERYDDAVARLYRALELLAQVHLWKRYQIKTGDVNIEKLPELVQEKYKFMRSPSNNKIELALRKSYELLSELSNDTLGLMYQEKENAILNALKIRNYSILAHGLRPINNSDYQSFSKVVIPFIEVAIAAVVPGNLKLQSVQFPHVISI
ncbi:MAG: TIGR02710 family CRISPR-associated CARF protein [Aulosira sp. ZfuVER01]|nr:TIGR02710 family CRISPR-associated CARF protein [Aulosira sp. ZfuVER01]MDZ7997613.1 TIGR02710 family CRISPR-associated CARF protein [Aulosira sp. DedVER01a]MDZ8054615.1 TIGR02710 family CRISPR-associated CARF protein [Aulosira sp. ZfuCHP01]